jgi:branched-chain amino acid transport system substrate-binding protein
MPACRQEEVSVASNEPSREMLEQLLGRELRRRDFLRWSAAAATSAGLASFLAACNPAASTAAPSVLSVATPAGSAAAVASPSAAASFGRTIKIGYVSPKTGPLAPFAEADDFILNGIQQAYGAGLVIGGITHPIQVVTKDAQSDSNVAAQVASSLILDDKVDLMLVASTPDMTNPVADQCEANGVPCISSVAPWQPYYLGRQKDPANPKPFAWTYHFFWGLEDIIAVFLDMWGQVPTNKSIGGLWPNDPDGNAWSDPAHGFPPAFASAGYTLKDPGRYADGTSDFSAQISAFKAAKVEILTGVPIPPDFTTFYKQAAQQGFKPKVASVGKALLFPSSVEALGDLGLDLSSECWWSPSHPFSSSLTGATAKALADSYTSATQKQWTQPIGFVHALFEVTADALKRTTNIEDKGSIRDAIKATSLNTIVGKVDWTTGQPVPNVSKTPLVGAQWRKGTTFQYDLVIVSNKDHPEIPAGGTMELIAG